MEEYIKLPISLGVEITKILKEKYSIEPRKGKNGLLSSKFTKEELNKIKTLNIINPSKYILEGIELLENLETLSIETLGAIQYTQDKNITSISEESFLKVEKLKSLKNLKIKNQNYISSIDVSELETLETLELVGNDNLTEVKGLDKWENIYYFGCYGNRQLFNIPNLNTVINRNEISKLHLDLLLFTDAINYNPIDKSYDQKAMEKMKELGSFCKFVEQMRGNKNIEMSLGMTLNFHNKCTSITDDISKTFHDDVGKIIGVEEYLAKNVIYDDDAVLTTHRSHTSNGIVIGPQKGSNGAHNAVMLNTCVCEGYTRAMQYLLKLYRINTRNVSCIAGKDTLQMATNQNESIYSIYDLPEDGYHSIICLEGYNNLYCDPCWNACRYQAGDKSLPYTMLNKKEISRTHTLSFQERNVTNDHINAPKDLINKYINNEPIKTK